MQEKLVIYLHAHDLAHPSWAVVDRDNAVRQSAYRDSALGLSSIAEDKEVVVIAPAEDVLLTSTTFPKMHRSRLLQAIPFALEEQLIEDLDKLHFAAGGLQPNGELPVAVVAHAKMQEWLTQLQTWNIKADTLISAALATPFAEQHWTVMVDEMAIVRTSLTQGFGCDKNNLLALTKLALTTQTHLPTLIQIRNGTNHAFAAMLDVGIQVKEDFIQPAEYMADLAHHAVKKPIINLLQGAYAVKKSHLPQMGKVWQAVTYLASAWVALLFLYPTVSYLILGQRVHAIDDQIAAIYQRHFPEAQSIVAPKMRMEEKLQKLTARIGENRVLLLMGYVGNAMLETPSIKLKRLDFQSNQLTLELTAGSSEDFTAFCDFLTHQGLGVKQQNANLAGARINATLQIE